MKKIAGKKFWTREELGKDPLTPEEIGLFPDEGVGSARRSPDSGRGLPRMKVPTPLIWKTSTCVTLPSPVLT